MQIDLNKLGVIPVVEIADSNKAVNLAKALLSGGIKAIEVTFRTDSALESIKKIHDSGVKILLGAGTVLSCQQADDAIKAGADFLVSPGFNPQVVQYCMDKNYPIYPGVNNPADIEQAIAMGLTTLKFFPAEASGGIKMLKAFSGPYKQIKFMPTGGINGHNITNYLDLNNVVCCGGSWMIDKQKLINEDFDGIRKDAQKAMFDCMHLQIIGISDNGKLIVNCHQPQLIPKNIKDELVIEEV